MKYMDTPIKVGKVVFQSRKPSYGLYGIRARVDSEFFEQRVSNKSSMTLRSFFYEYMVPVIDGVEDRSFDIYSEHLCEFNKKDYVFGFTKKLYDRVLSGKWEEGYGGWLFTVRNGYLYAKANDRNKRNKSRKMTMNKPLKYTDSVRNKDSDDCGKRNKAGSYRLKKRAI